MLSKTSYSYKKELNKLDQLNIFQNSHKLPLYFYNDEKSVNTNSWFKINEKLESNMSNIYAPILPITTRLPINTGKIFKCKTFKN